MNLNDLRDVIYDDAVAHGLWENELSYPLDDCCELINDELKELAGKQKDRLAHIPAIMPISELDLRQMASGYGYRVDPVYRRV